MADKVHRITAESSFVKFEFKGEDTRIVPDVTNGLSVSTGDALFIGNLTVGAAINGVFDGPGALPVGGVIGILPHLAGAYNCTATTVADSQGFVQCNGQTISDVTSPMNGVTVPNINNNVFLAGHTTSGTTGGTNSYTISTSMLPPHTHTIDHGHSLNTTDASVTTTGASSAANTSDASNTSVANCTFSSGGSSSASTGTVSANHCHSGTSGPSGAHTHVYAAVTSFSSVGAINSVDASLTFTQTTTTDSFGPAGPHAHSYSISSADAHTHTISSHSHSSPHSHTLSSHTHTLSAHSHSMNSHTHSVGSLALSGSSGNGGFANVAVDNRPIYITTKYIMRVK